MKYVNLKRLTTVQINSPAFRTTPWRAVKVTILFMPISFVLTLCSFHIMLIICFFFRPDQKAKASLHTKGRKDALANSNALCANANGWAVTAGPTRDNNALSVTSTYIRTSRDRWTNLTGLTYRIRPRSILRICVRSARAWGTTVAGLNRVKQIMTL